MTAVSSRISHVSERKPALLYAGAVGYANPARRPRAARPANLSPPCLQMAFVPEQKATGGDGGRGDSTEGLLLWYNKCYTRSMKTAISIPEAVFRSAEQLADRLGV